MHAGWDTASLSSSRRRNSGSGVGEREGGPPSPSPTLTDQLALGALGGAHLPRQQLHMQLPAVLALLVKPLQDAILAAQLELVTLPLQAAGGQQQGGGCRLTVFFPNLAQLPPVC